MSIHVHNEEALQEFEALAREGGKPLSFALYGDGDGSAPVYECVGVGPVQRITERDIIEARPRPHANINFGEKRKFLA